jgi:hypothetical protein
LLAFRLSIPVDQSNLAFVTSQKAAARKFRVVQGDVESALSTISIAMSVLDFETAMEECEKLMPEVSEFVANASEFASRVSQHTCDSAARITLAHHPEAEVSYLMVLIIANCMAMIAIVLTQSKAKIRVKVD